MTVNRNPIGCMIAQRISAALLGLGIDYQIITDVVYQECLNIASEHEVGDWIEMPNGDTYTKTYTVERTKE